MLSHIRRTLALLLPLALFLTLGVPPRASAAPTPPVLPAGRTGTPYLFPLAAEGSTSTGWAVTSGELPSGLSLSPDGLLSGTPDAAGTYSFSVAGGADVGTESLTLRVNPGADGSPFTLSGSTIRYPDDGLHHGEPFIAKGINIEGPYWPYGRDMIRDAGLIGGVWGFNAVRICCFPALAGAGVPMGQGTIAGTTDPLAALIAEVDVYAAQGIVCIVENHDCEGTYPEDAPQPPAKDGYTVPSLSQMEDWWKGVAAAFADNPYVWFNLINEPGLGRYGSIDSKAKWVAVSEALIDAIRGAGADNIIVCDDHNWGQGGGTSIGSAVCAAGAQLEQHDPAHSVVFSLHMYDGWAGGEARLTQYAQSCADQQLPLIIGEYGVGTRADISATAAMYNVCAPLNIGRLAWMWNDASFPMTADRSAQFPGAGYTIDTTDGAKPTNLSWIGGLIWDDTHGGVALPVEKPGA